MSVSRDVRREEVVGEQASQSWWSRLLLNPLLWQVLIVACALAAWQWIPTIPGIQDASRVFDPFFISSPTRVAHELSLLVTGDDGRESIWRPFVESMVPAVVGTALAVAAGALVGLVCSNWLLLNRIVRPFLVAFNALPRITLIPIVVVIGGSGTIANVIIGFLVVFFLVFFSAYQGGVSVPREMLENVRVLGAKPRQIIWRVRWPLVMAWTFAQLPNAVAFGVTAIITMELFTGSQGLGGLLLLAVQNSNADLTVAVALVLAVSSLLLIGAADYARSKLLHWQG
jgi:NitT/TauT family transport system permease protein